MSEIAEQFLAVQARVRAACERVGRAVAGVELIAVSKTFPASDIAEVVGVGQRCFGESRLQEAEPKIGELPKDLEWHFIGGVQRNKVRKILPLFSYVHAVDSWKLAAYIDQVAGELGLRPKIFLQVNQAGEVSKGGFAEADLVAGLENFSGLRNVEVVGLMSIPPASESEEEARGWFRGLRELRDRMEAGSELRLGSLSMGMSGDFEVAIEEGATHVRVGSSIFGRRGYRVEGELG